MVKQNGDRKTFRGNASREVRSCWKDTSEENLIESEDGMQRYKRLLANTEKNFERSEWTQGPVGKIIAKVWKMKQNKAFFDFEIAGE